MERLWQTSSHPLIHGVRAGAHWSDSSTQTLSVRRGMETMKTQTITDTISLSLVHPPTHTLFYFHNTMHWLSYTRTHILPGEFPSYRSGCSTGSAKRRKCRETYRESERWANVEGKKRSAERREVKARWKTQKHSEWKPIQLHFLCCVQVLLESRKLWLWNG